MIAVVISFRTSLQQKRRFYVPDDRQGVFLGFGEINAEIKRKR